MTYEYRVVFHYNKEPKIGLLKRIYEHEYMRLRNMACDLLNDHYEEWNAEFDQKYPDKNGEDPEYHRFIANKQNKILKELDNESKIIILRSNQNNGADIVAISKIDWMTRFYITLTEA